MAQGELCKKPSPQSSLRRGDSTQKPSWGILRKWRGWHTFLPTQRALRIFKEHRLECPRLGTVLKSPRLAACQPPSFYANKWRLEFGIGNCTKWFGLAEVSLCCGKSILFPRQGMERGLSLVGPCDHRAFFHGSWQCEEGDQSQGTQWVGWTWTVRLWWKSFIFCNWDIIYNFRCTTKWFSYFSYILFQIYSWKSQKETNILSF